MAHALDVSTALSTHSFVVASQFTPAARAPLENPPLPEHKREQLREKNRLAQRKSRAKFKAEAAVAEQRRDDVSRQLTAAKAELLAKQQLFCALHEAAATRALHACRSRTQLHEAARVDAVPPSPPVARRRPPRERPSSAPQPARPRGSALFAFPAGEGAPLPFAADIALGLLPPGESLFARLCEFQAREARRLGCSAGDVAWMYRCTFAPRITVDAAIPSNLHPSACKSLTSLAWCAARLECAMLLALCRRLDKAAGALPTERLGGRPAPATGGDGQREPGGGSIGARATGLPSDPDAGEGGGEAAVDADALSDRVYAFLLTDTRVDSVPRIAAAASPPSPRGAGLERWSRPDALPAFVALVRQVLGAIFREYIPSMHPADVVSLSRRLVRAHEPQGSAESTRSAAAGPLTTASGFAACIAEVLTLSRLAMRDACANPRVPPQPNSQEAAALRRDAYERRMGLVYADWTLLYTLIALGSPRWVCQVAVGFNPAVAGYAKFEQLNLEAYKMLALSGGQKRAIAAAWHRYRARLGELASETSDLAAALASLPAHCGADSEGCAPALPPATHAAHRQASIRGRDGVVRDSTAYVRSSRSPPDWASAPGFGPGADCARHVGGARGGERWTQQLLGAAPGPTAAAADVLAGLQRVHAERRRAYVEYLCAFKDALSPRQQVVWFTGQLPFVSDSLRISVIACSDLVCERVYGRAICGAAP